MAISSTSFIFNGSLFFLLLLSLFACSKKEFHAHRVSACSQYIVLHGYRPMPICRARHLPWTENVIANLRFLCSSKNSNSHHQQSRNLLGKTEIGRDGGKNSMKDINKKICISQKPKTSELVCQLNAICIGQMKNREERKKNQISKFGYIIYDGNSHNLGQFIN